MSDVYINLREQFNEVAFTFNGTIAYILYFVRGSVKQGKTIQ